MYSSVLTSTTRLKYPSGLTATWPYCYILRVGLTYTGPYWDVLSGTEIYSVKLGYTAADLDILYHMLIYTVS